MVGFFDSGVGGRCVLDAFRRLRPDEPTIYVADTANCPYGNKPPAEIVARSKEIAADLIRRGCRVVVVACNTATAAAIDTLRATWPDIRFVGMEPAVKPAALGSRTGVVAVLATRGTLNGRLYRQTSARIPGSVKIIECVADEFVELVERGETSGAAVEASVKARLEPLLEAGADRIVLGCTHFPHLKPVMEKVVRGRAEIVDPSDAVARRIVEVMKGEG
jgi:glutamate racemase